MITKKIKRVISNKDFESYNTRFPNLNKNKILVTGAAGSIGSRLCDQIAKLKPRLLIAADFRETELFYLEMQLMEETSQLNLVTKILDIKDRAGVNLLLKNYRPDTIFHAAAYKHVTMMENNPREAILNNILGTKNLLELAGKNKVKKFINISTDKAVYPSGVMGATKRIAEKIIRCNKTKSLKKINIRLGNVLGSRGSVLPIFQQQIIQGGPITITDKNMTRYFMTIEEAIFLLLYVFRIGRDKKTYILDMGKPIKIIDLADKLIKTYGLRSNKNIKISLIGKKAGEKISEQLYFKQETIKKTSFSKIYEIEEKIAVNENFMKKVEKIINFCLIQSKNDNIIKEKVMRLAK